MRHEDRGGRARTEQVDERLGAGHASGAATLETLVRRMRDRQDRRAQRHHFARSAREHESSELAALGVRQFSFDRNVYGTVKDSPVTLTWAMFWQASNVLIIALPRGPDIFVVDCRAAR